MIRWDVDKNVIWHIWVLMIADSFIIFTTQDWWWFMTTEPWLFIDLVTSKIVKLMTKNAVKLCKTGIPDVLLGGSSHLVSGFITPVINGISKVYPLITGVITHRPPWPIGPSGGAGGTLRAGAEVGADRWGAREHREAPFSGCEFLQGCSRVIFLGNKCWDWVLDSGWEDVELLYLRMWRAVHGRVIVGKKMHVLYVVIFRESE